MIKRKNIAEDTELELWVEKVRSQGQCDWLVNIKMMFQIVVQIFDISAWVVGWGKITGSGLKFKKNINTKSSVVKFYFILFLIKMKQF